MSAALSPAAPTARLRRHPPAGEPRHGANRVHAASWGECRLLDALKSSFLSRMYPALIVGGGGLTARAPV